MAKPIVHVEYPPPQCEVNGHHHFIEVSRTIFVCKHCYWAKWQPVTMHEAVKFGGMVHFGTQQAYNKMLADKPRAREILTIWESIRDIRDKLSPDLVEKLITAASEDIHVEDGYSKVISDEEIGVIFEKPPKAKRSRGKGGGAKLHSPIYR